MTRTCELCSSTYEAPLRSKSKFCSKTCRFESAALARRKCDFDELFFERGSTTTAYWAGVIVADGWVLHHPYSTTLHLALKEGDADHLRSFASDIGVDVDTDILVFRETLARVQLCSPKLRTGLERWGVIPGKTYNLRSIPEAWNDPEFSVHLARGLWDGDGHVGCNPNCYGYIQPRVSFVSSSIIVDWMVRLLEDWDVDYIRRDRPSKILQDGTEYIVSDVAASRHSEMLKLVDRLGYFDRSLPALDRKREAAFHIDAWVNRQQRRRPNLSR